MSEVASSAQNQQAKPKTLFGKILGLPLTLFGVLCASLLLSIIVEIVGMHFFWKEQGWRHAETMFYYEVKQFSETFTQSLLVSKPVEKTGWILSQAHEWLFVKTGLTEQAQAVLTPTEQDIARKLEFRGFISMVYSGVQDYVLAAAFTALTFIVRVLVLVLSLPLVVLAVMVGLVDGLVRRDIRRMTAGYESGFIYHRARSLLIPLVVLPWMIYLALPVSISPVLILLPGALQLGTAVNITAGSFKRYI